MNSASGSDSSTMANRIKINSTRQRAADAGQRYFQARGDDRQCQVTEEADKILGFPAG